MPSKPSSCVEVIPNPYPSRDYLVTMECPEFTCLCPKTGQPDFALINICYVPDKLCVELKSLKCYLWSYRDRGMFHEKAVNLILDDMASSLKPRYMKVEAVFNIRGGIKTTVAAEYSGKKGSRK